jgi:hypothetical protein
MDDVSTGLEAFLSLTHSLTLQGPGTWWDRATKEQPLSLIDALIAVGEVSACATLFHRGFCQWPPAQGCPAWTCLLAACLLRLYVKSICQAVVTSLLG